MASVFAVVVEAVTRVLSIHWQQLSTLHGGRLGTAAVFACGAVAYVLAVVVEVVTHGL